MNDKKKGKDERQELLETKLREIFAGFWQDNVFCLKSFASSPIRLKVSFMQSLYGNTRYYAICVV